MKKFIAIAATFISLFSGIQTVSAEVLNAEASSQWFIINGRPVITRALNINGSNYIKVLEMAELLDIGITFNETTKAVILDKSKPFTGLKIISEPAAGEEADSKKDTNALTTIYFDSPPVRVTVNSTDGNEHMVLLNYSIAVQTESTEISADYEKLIRSNEKVIEDIIIRLLHEVEYDSLVNTNFIDDFSRIMVKEINSAINANIVKDFLILDFFLQN